MDFICNVADVGEKKNWIAEKGLFDEFIVFVEYAFSMT